MSSHLRSEAQPVERARPAAAGRALIFCGGRIACIDGGIGCCADGDRVLTSSAQGLPPLLRRISDGGRQPARAVARRTSVASGPGLALALALELVARDPDRGARVRGRIWHPQAGRRRRNPTGDHRRRRRRSIDARNLARATSRASSARALSTRADREWEIRNSPAPTTESRTSRGLYGSSASEATSWRPPVP